MMEATCELKMPANYVELSEDEMMDLDGGWAVSTVGKNLRELYNNYKAVRNGLPGAGITIRKAWRAYWTRLWY